MINKEDYIRAWESRVSERSCHLNIENFNQQDLQYLYAQYQLIIDNYDFENKTVLDLGCGGGLFGKYLSLKECKIKKYIGLDIAERCIIETLLNNLCWDEKECKKIDPFDFELKMKANILIVLNVIRFLPDLEYIQLFFDKLNRSGIKKIFIHFRKGNENIFRQKSYKTTHDIGQANYLNLDFVIEMMNKYKAIKITNKNENCYVFFEKKTKKRKERNDNTISD